MASNHRLSALLRLVLIIGALVPIALRAQARFSESLSPADWKAAGFANLSTEQLATLDGMIQRDVDSARQGDVVAFAKSFTDRRTPEERERAGLNRLSEIERAKLDSIIAGVIATRPAVAFVPHPATKGMAKEIATGPRPWEVHGQVSMFVGGGSGGRSFYGGDFDVWATDPTGHITVGVGASDIRGKGWGYGCSRGPIW